MSSTSPTDASAARAALATIRRMNLVEDDLRRYRALLRALAAGPAGGRRALTAVPPRFLIAGNSIPTLARYRGRELVSFDGRRPGKRPLRWEGGPGRVRRLSRVQATRYDPEPSEEQDVTYWIEPRHPEESSPIHPTKWEMQEGPRLYFDPRKAARVGRTMAINDVVFLYETAKNPRDPSWTGACAVGAAMVVTSAPYLAPDVHENSKTGRAEDWKVDGEWSLLLRDWRAGIGIREVCRILGRDPRWRPLTIQRIEDGKGRALLTELTQRTNGTAR